jgi:hypothetical protein
MTLQFLSSKWWKANSGLALCVVVLLLTIVVSVMLVWSHSAKPELLITILGVVAGIAVVVYQLGEQQNASLALQRENARQKLWLQVYEELKARASAARERSSKARWYAYSIVSQLELFVGGVERSLPPWDIKARAPEFLGLSSDANQELITLIAEIEQWEIAFDSADIFRIALSSVSRDIENAFHPFFQLAVTLLPTDRPAPGQGTFPHQPIARESLERLRRLASAYLEARDELHCYLHDLIVEAQNQLLSSLFRRRVAIRVPLDDNHKVITESRRKSLLHYFHNETAWGQANNDAINLVMADQGKRDRKGG